MSKSTSRLFRSVHQAASIRLSAVFFRETSQRTFGGSTYTSTVVF
jgi:hypothetical protein